MCANHARLSCAHDEVLPLSKVPLSHLQALLHLIQGVGPTLSAMGSLKNGELVESFVGQKQNSFLGERDRLSGSKLDPKVRVPSSVTWT